MPQMHLHRLASRLGAQQTSIRRGHSLYSRGGETVKPTHVPTRCPGVAICGARERDGAKITNIPRRATCDVCRDLVAGYRARAKADSAGIIGTVSGKSLTPVAK